MIRRVLALALGLALVSVPLLAEVGYLSISATQTSVTRVFPKPSNAVMVCNLGANEAYFRLFTEVDTTAAATTSNILLPAGSATAPECTSFDYVTTGGARFAAISVVCDTGETATVTVTFN